MFARSHRTNLLMNPAATTHKQLTKAVLNMLGATFSFAVMTAFIKAAKDYPIWQVIFFRYLAATVVIVVFLLYKRQITTLTTKRPLLHFSRAATGFISMFFTFLAAREIDLNLCNALTNCKALFILPMAACFLREKFSARRWLLTMLGFCGVIIILNPASPQLNTGEMAGLGAAFFAALSMITIRSLSGSEPVLTIVFYFMSLGTLFSVYGAWSVWQPILSMTDFLRIISVGISGALGQLFLVAAYKNAEASVIAPLEFAQVIWAALLGFLIWNEVPGGWLVIGASLVLYSQVALQLNTRKTMRRLLEVNQVSS